jgi:cytochrome c peroxidase
VPPTFAESELEILGVTERWPASSPRLDPDVGRFASSRIELDRFAFKTPTVRNVALTAPYMHNGAFKTLEEVIDFYDRGGALGLGLDLPTQTLPGDRLDLTALEKSDIIAFLHALTDTVGTTARPRSLPTIVGKSGRAVGGRY